MNNEGPALTMSGGPVALDCFVLQKNEDAHRQELRVPTATACASPSR